MATSSARTKGPGRPLAAQGRNGDPEPQPQHAPQGDLRQQARRQLPGESRRHLRRDHPEQHRGGKERQAKPDENFRGAHRLLLKRCAGCCADLR